MVVNGEENNFVLFPPVLIVGNRNEPVFEDFEDAILPLLQNENDVNREDLQMVQEEAIAEIEAMRDRPNQLLTYLMAINHENVEAMTLGEFNNNCMYCGAKFFAAERNSRQQYTKCCHLGNIVLPPLQELPVVLDGLYRDIHPHSRTFLRNILQYNNAFQFASTQAKLRTPPPGRGPMIYTIQGKVYHHLGDVVVPEPENSKYGTVYFLESHEAIGRRGQLHEALNENLLQLLEQILREHNPFAQGIFFN